MTENTDVPPHPGRSLAAAVSGHTVGRRINWLRIAEAYALLAGLVVIGAVFGFLRPEGHYHMNRFYWSVLTTWQDPVSIKSMG
jgi:hypothetical protein